ncbi:MAG: methionyl-tRNA formyltransferase [Candidatus Kapabacteria bacterium]|jgi:methionyl-tRNA formyltransferase|nr:methionyl-tRNA formyltransferase [Candidatus Kapabacteria bacterium]
MTKIDKPSIIYMGTPEFAVPALVALHEKYTVRAVVTIPDKPKGRGKKLAASAVKEKAIELGIPVLQPELLKDQAFIDALKSYEPDIMAVLAFRILPESVYSISKIATFNIHGSLLPKYRGAAPINHAILNGDKVSGLTSFVLEKQVDTGQILIKSPVDILDGSTAGDLHDMLMPVAAQLGLDTCELLLSGDYTLLSQNDTEATPAPKVFRENCGINWNAPAEQVRNFIHSVSPSPAAWTLWEGQRLKIMRVDFVADGSGSPGEFKIEDGQFVVQCGKGSVSLIEIQVQGKKKMKTVDFWRGYRGDTSGKFE